VRAVHPQEVVRVVLAPHRQQLSLTFPLLVKVLDGPVPFYEHVWQSQVCLSLLPPSWLWHPLFPPFAETLTRMHGHARRKAWNKGCEYESLRRLASLTWLGCTRGRRCL